jgi:hypothetical protein
VTDVEDRGSPGPLCAGSSALPDDPFTVALTPRGSSGQPQPVAQPSARLELPTAPQPFFTQNIEKIHLFLSIEAKILNYAMEDSML